MLCRSQGNGNFLAPNLHRPLSVYYACILFTRTGFGGGLYMAPFLTRFTAPSALRLNKMPYWVEGGAINRMVKAGRELGVPCVGYHLASLCVLAVLLDPKCLAKVGYFGVQLHGFQAVILSAMAEIKLYSLIGADGDRPGHGVAERHVS